MRRTFIIAAAIGSLVASSAFAGFVVSHTTTSVDATLDRIDIFARNTGGDTGTGLLAVEMSSDATAGEAVWRSTSAGNWSPTNPADIASRSFVRVDFEDVSSTSLVSKTPAANQPLAAAYGPLTVALGDFGVVIAGLAGAIPAETGNGALFASLFVSKNFASTISGNVGGSAGAKVPFSFDVGSVVVNGRPVITPASQTVNVVFGQIVTNGAPFSATVSITDPEGDAITAALGALPASVTGATITPAGGSNYTIAGTVDYSANGTDVVVPFTASDAGGPSSGSVTLHVTPEPASLSLIGLSGLLMGRRRK